MVFAKICLLSAFVVAALAGSVDINEGKYALTFTVSLPNVLNVKITAATTGWVGWGISPNGSMIMSDMVIGGFHPTMGAYIGDRYSAMPGAPKLDDMQNVNLVSAWENMTHTVLEFNRLLNTGDAAEDIIVQNMVQFVVWATGMTDDVTYHEMERGAVEINLMS